MRRVTDLNGAREKSVRGGLRSRVAGTPRVRYIFDCYELDKERVELRRRAERVPIEPQVFDLLLYLIDNRGRVVGKDELFDQIWGGRIVSLSTLTSRINAARAAIGDDGAAQRLIRTVPRRGYRFVSDVEAIGAQAATERTPRGPRQSIQFCVTSDGARIAYAEAGLSDNRQSGQLAQPSGI